MHTALSRAIATVPGMDDTINEFAESLWGAAPRLLEAVQRWPASQEPSQTAFVSLPALTYGEGEGSC
jgi:hypothetical protein